MKWGLVLSGGAAYGLANAGVVTVLEREGLRPACIAGSSMGAIVGALYALTGSAAVFPELLDTLRLSNIARWSERPFAGGLHGGLLRQRLEELLGPVLGSATIGDCVIPFVCIAGEVRAPIDWKRITRPGFTEYVRTRVTPHVFPPETPLLDAVTASSAIPVVFSPVVIGERTFLDLVHFGAIPARTLRALHHPDIVIATDTNPRYLRLLKALPKPWAEFLREGYAELEESRESCDLVIEPHMPAALWRFDRAREFVDAGKAATQEALPEIRKILGGVMRT